MGKRTVIPEFQFNGKPWVVIPKQPDTWYPSLIDHATILVGIGMCEERRYPQVSGKEGWKYMMRYYQRCLSTVKEYTSPDTGLIIPFNEWDINEIHEKCTKIYNKEFDPRNKKRE